MARINLSANALLTLKKRYFQKLQDNGLETPVEMFDRISRAVAAAEANYGSGEVDVWADKYFELLTSLCFLPNSPTIRYAGSNKKGCLSACLVLPVEDSRKSIFQTLYDAVESQARGLGTGYNFSTLRPKGAEINSTGGKASGPISFMTIYDVTIGPVIAQGGFRRGAQMGILNCDHPQIEEFIGIKQKEGILSSFNLSVGITDKFMRAVKDDADWELSWGGEVYKTIKAKDLWESILISAWHNGEPGIIFLDRVNKDNPFKDRCNIVATNPCGEQPLPPYGICNLGSINLAQMYSFRNKAVNWTKLEETVKLSVRFLDDVIDVNYYPLPQIEEVAKGSRLIGLGVMGWADLLILLNIKYNSDDAISLAKKVGKFINEKARDESIVLGKERGTYPWWNLANKINPGPIRNAARTTIAPTGTLSIIAGCSSGIEPNFAWQIDRSGQLDGELNIEYHPLAEEYIKEGKELPECFIASHEIETEWHVKMQAAWQQNVDNAISKTINAPNSATVADVDRSFWMAYDLGCKGITFYRDGSRERQVLSMVKAKGKKNGESFELPEIMKAKRINMMTNKGKASLFVVIDDNKFPVEFYVNPPVESPDTAAIMTAICRLIAVGIQGFEDLDEYLDQLKKANKMYDKGSGVLTYIIKTLRAGKNKKGKGIEILLDMPVEDEDEVIVKCIYNIMKLAQSGCYELKEYIEIMKQVNEEYGNISTILTFIIKAFNKFLEVLNLEEGKVIILKDACPECGSKMMLREGCSICIKCNFSKCS